MKKPNYSVLHIYIDGASRGNPGPAGIGIVITDESGVALKNIDKSIGHATNNIAEYTALISGMEEARGLGAKELIINTDSELIAKQLGGEYKVKNPVLKDLYAKVTRLLNNFEQVRINSIPREDNKVADKLANKAIDDVAKKRTGKSFILKSR
jgi:ribonuclease HI